MCGKQETVNELRRKGFEERILVKHKSKNNFLGRMAAALAAFGLVILLFPANGVFADEEEPFVPPVEETSIEHAEEGEASVIVEESFDFAGESEDASELTSEPAPAMASYTIVFIFDGVENEEWRTVLQGQVGAMTAAAPVWEDGYTPLPIEQQVIAADGSTAVTVNYVTDENGEGPTPPEGGWDMGVYAAPVATVYYTPLTPPHVSQVTVRIETDALVTAPQGGAGVWTSPFGTTYALNWECTYSVNTVESLVVEKISGETATVIVTVNQIDDVAPVMNVAEITATSTQYTFGGNSAYYITSGNTVTLHLTANEALGANPAVTIAGQPATVTDTSGGARTSFSASLMISASVAEGNIPFTVAFADVVGNIGTPITSTTNGSVVFLDKTTPTLTAVNINSSGTAYVRAGGPVTIAFTASEELDISSITATIGGVSATSVVQTGANTYEAILLAVPSAFTEGNLSFTLNYADLAGISGSTVIVTTDGSTVTVDNTAPTLTAVHIEGSVVADYAGTGHTVLLTFTASEMIDLNTLTVMFDGVSASLITPIGGNTYTASLVVPSTFTEGVILFTINYRDLAGNAGVQVTATTDGSTVTFDKTAPTLSNVSITGTGGATYIREGQDVILIFTANEALDLSATSVTFGGVLPTSVTLVSGNTYRAAATIPGGYPEGAIAFTINYADTVGNAGTWISGTTDASEVIFDATAPTLSAVHIAGTGGATYIRAGQAVSLTFTASEELDIANLVVEFGGVPAGSVVSTGGNSYRAYFGNIPATFPEGEIAFTIDYTDRAGNSGTQVTAATDGSKVIFDVTPPVLGNVRISGTGGATYIHAGQAVSLTFTASEELDIANLVVEFGGVSAGSVVSTGGSSYRAYFGNIPATFPEGEIAFTIDYTDIAGNAGVQVTATTDGSKVIFDATPPTVSNIHINGTGGRIYVSPGMAVALTFDASEVLSMSDLVIEFGGIPAVAIVPTGGGSYRAYFAPIPATFPEGEIAFTIDYADLAGNAGVQVTATTDGSKVIFDCTAPTAVFTYTPPTQTSGQVEITMTISESILTPAGWQRISDTVYKKVVSVNGAGQVEIEDLAGNKSTVTYNVSWIVPPPAPTAVPGTVTPVVPRPRPRPQSNSSSSESSSSEEEPEEIIEEPAPLEEPPANEREETTAILNTAILALLGIMAILMLVAYTSENNVIPDEKRRYSDNGKFMLLGVPVFILAAAAFFFTQSITSNFVWIDKWTVLFAAGVVIQSMFAALGSRRSVR